MNIPDFKSEPERRTWFIENASCFTVVRRANRRYFKVECATLDDARMLAQWVVAKYDRTARLMIYAVVGTSDTWVENIQHADSEPVHQQQHDRRPVRPG